jgi:hypothetical protein
MVRNNETPDGHVGGGEEILTLTRIFIVLAMAFFSFVLRPLQRNITDLTNVCAI